MADALATAFAKIEPTFDGFRPLLEAGLRAAMTGVKATVQVGADTGPAKKDLLGLAAVLKTVTAKPYTIKINVDTSRATLQALIGQSKEAAAAQHAAADSARAFAFALFTEAAAAQAATAALKDYTRAALAAAGAGGAAGGGARKDGGGGFIGPFLGGFGGGAIAGLLGGRIAGIAAWHLALDAVVETLIAVGSAAAAAALGVAAMAPAAQDVFTQLKSVQTVNSALGDQIPTLASKFGTLADKMAPQVIEAYGGALSVVSRNTGAFARVGGTVTTMFDDMIAKIDIWARTSGVVNKLLNGGIGFLHQFGQAAGYLGDALYNLLKAEPGVAHFLADILVGAAKVLDVITKLPTPVLATAFAIHGAYIWGRVLGGALLSAANGALKFGASLVGLAANPLAWAAVAAAGMGYLAYESTQATNATKALIGGLESGLANAPASQAITQLAGDMGVLQRHIEAIHATPAISGLFAGFTPSSTWSEAWHKTLGTLEAVGSFFAGNPLGTGRAGASVAAMNNEINKMLGSSRNLAGELGHLMHAGYSFRDALALMDLAGVRWNDTVAVMNQKVQNLIGGYKAMGIQGGLLSNSVEAVNFAALQQQSKVGQLTQAWSAYFGTLTSGETGFTTFGQDVLSLNKALGGTGGTARTVVGTFHSAQKAAGDTGTSITGLNAKSLQLRSTWLQSAQAAQTQLDNLTQMASAAGEGAKGTRLLTQAAKDMVAQLLPAAKGSKALTAILYGLAQQGGYQGADSFKALAKWVGNVHDPMKNLDKITTTLTIDMGNLQGDVKKLSTALGTTLNNAMATAIFTASGGIKPLDNLAAAIHNTGANSTTTHDAAVKLAAQLITLTGNTTSAHKEFDTFAFGMGLTKQQADKLWASVVRAGEAIADLHSKHVNLTETGFGHFSITGPGGQTVAGPGGRFSSGRPLAAGGRVPGSGNRDSFPAMLTPGEAVVPKHLVGAVAPFLGAHRVPGFASGGYVGSVGGLAGQTTAWSNSFQQSMTRALESAMRRGMQSAQQAFFGGGLGGSGVQRWASLVLRVLAMLGQPASDLGVVLRQMQTESGGRVNAINLTDSNAAAGDPSRGLMQVIGTTFDAYAGPFRGLGIYNPLANIYAGLNYAIHRYGADWTSVLGQGHGYDSGGWLPPGASIAWNGTGRPERVVGPDGLAVTLVIDGRGNYGRFLANEIRQLARVEGGGDVQVAFGTRS